MRLAALGGHDRPGPETGRDAGDRLLRSGERGHRCVGLGPSLGSRGGGRRRSPRGLVPAGVGGEEDRRGELVPGREAGRLLLGLDRQPPDLRAELGDDVLDPREVRLGLDELLLGPSAAALVAADAGDLLEQRPPLLGPERERLVDHPLADEQEGVVGEVGAIEEVDEVAQADALAVEEVLVLARAVQSPAQLDLAEVDRQEGVGVVEDQGDVGHPERGALLGAGEDDVFALARPKGATLLTEGPAKGVGEVALARSVRADDGADARSELDGGPLGERLEAVEPQAQEAAPTPSPGRTVAMSLARSHGVEGLRGGGRLGDPSRRPLTDPDDDPVDRDLDPELLLVVRADGLDDAVLRSRAGRAAGSAPGDGSSGS